MKALYCFTRKNLIQNKNRTIVTIIGIILSSFLLFSLGFCFTIYQTKETKEAILNIGNYHFAYFDIDGTSLNKLKNRNEIKKIEVESLLDCFDLAHYDVNLYVRDSYELSNIKVISGNYPKKEGEILLSNVIAGIYGKTLNDVVSIQGTEYKIVGIFENYMHYINQDIYAYGNKGTEKYRVYMTLNQPTYENIHALSESLGFERIGFSSIKSYEHEHINDKLLQTYGQYNDDVTFAVRSLLLMILLTVLSVVCILVIYNAFAISVTERKKTLGILRSIGATPGQLLKSVFYEATIVSLVAIPIGFLLAFLGSYIIVFIGNHFFTDILAFPLEVHIYPLYVFMCLIFIVVSVYLSAFFPAMRAREVTPLEAIKSNDDIKLKQKKIKSSIWIRKLFGIEGELAYKNKKRNKKKYRIVTLSLIIGIVLFMSFSAFLDIERVMFQEIQIEDTENIIHLILTCEESLKKEYEAQLLKGIKIDKMQKQKGFYATFESSHFSYNEKYHKKLSGMNGIMVISLNEKEYQEYQNKIGLREDKTILINRVRFKTYYDEELKIQDFDVFDYIEEVRLLSDEEIEHFDDLYLTTIFPDNYTNGFYPTIVVKETDYQKFVSKLGDLEKQLDASQTDYQIWTSDFRQLEKNYQSLKSTYPVVVFQYDNMAYASYQSYKQLEVINLLILLVIILLALIAITSVINTIYTSLQLRKKEFAMLRSVGMTPRKFYKMICYESFFFGVQSIIWGLLISTGIIYLIHNVLNIGKEGIKKIHYPYPFSYMWMTIIAVFVIVFISMLYSSRKAKKNNIVDILKEENF